MIWILGLPIAVCYMAIRDFLVHRDTMLEFGKTLDFSDYIIEALLLVFLGLVALAVGFIIARVVGCMYKTVLVRVRNIELVSLRGEIGIHGSAFLGTGFVDANEYYFYYKRIGADAYCPGKILASDNVVIHETTDERVGMLEEYEHEFVSAIGFLIGIPQISNKFKFSIPRGSLIKNFRIG